MSLAPVITLPHTSPSQAALDVEIVLLEKQLKTETEKIDKRRRGVLSGISKHLEGLRLWQDAFPTLPGSLVQLTDLKRRRNALSPISLLPAELMSFIFSTSLLFLIDKYRRNVFPEVTRLSISHVSHTWREIALASPELWRKVYIRGHTSLEYIDGYLRQWISTPDLPIDVEAHEIGYGYGTASVSHIFQAGVGLGRLRRISLKAPKVLLDTLLPELKACSTTIESLRLSLSEEENKTYVGMPEPGYDSVFRSPSLNRLELHNWIPPPNLLSKYRPISPVHLEISFYPSPALDTIRSLFNYLETTPQLISLALTFGRGDLSWKDDSTPTAIHLPSLERLRLSSYSRSALPAILSRLRIPSHIGYLKLLARWEGAVAPEAVKIASAFQHACADIPSPEFLRVWTSSLKGGGGDIRIVAKRTEHSQGLLNDAIVDFAIIEPYERRALMGVTNTYPFYESGLGWLFFNLRCIAVEHCALPLHFWRALAGVSTLEIIHYWVFQQDDGISQILRGEGGENSNAAPSKKRVVFTALRKVKAIFVRTPMFWDLDYAGELTLALQRKGITLDSLEFDNCISSIGSECLTLLQSVANQVVWATAN
ncbi:hypothetical protein D9611_007461 [Ephemerocybe angulata]|uniref:F-box domain-containing protein n=1 Tax=Ephemerocybe angulata TaxID=980116 RepID=A0A8H5FKX5_9AGAR|nr:hypothetical protein D9611_007461 [Tulosesus angulatus]